MKVQQFLFAMYRYYPCSRLCSLVTNQKHEFLNYEKARPHDSYLSNVVRVSNYFSIHAYSDLWSININAPPRKWSLEKHLTWYNVYDPFP